MLFDFVNLTNVYGFEIDKVITNSSSITLRPIGAGRNALIKIIYDNELYKNKSNDTSSISKLLSDFSKSININNEIAILVCKIAQFYIEDVINDSKIEMFRKHSFCKINISTLLNLSNYCSNWFKKYIDKLLKYLSSHNPGKIRFANDSISDLISIENCNLVDSNFHEVLKLFTQFFTENLEDENSLYSYKDKLDNNWKYGLNSNAELYMQIHRDYPPYISTCFCLLLKKNYFETLLWLIDFLNRLTNTYKKNDHIYEYDIYFVEHNIHKILFGNEKMWLTSCQEYQMPKLIGDIVFTFEKYTIYKVSTLNEQDRISFLKKIKDIIISKTNNIILIASLTHFGLTYSDVVPGYAIDFLTCIDLILMDCSRASLIKSNPAKAALEKELIRKIGLPSIDFNRYSQGEIKMDLRNYMLEVQLKNKTLTKKCNQILDYLYSITKNNKTEGLKYLQIEMMDIRKANIRTVHNNAILITPNLDGEALRIFESQKSIDSQLLQINELVEATNVFLKNKKFSETKTKELIQRYVNYIGHPYFPALSNLMFSLISYCLNRNELSNLTRDELCSIWLQLLDLKKANPSIIFDNKLYTILFKQLNFNLSLKNKNAIKNLILNSFICESTYDLNIDEIKSIARQFLKENHNVSRAVFNTIICLAEDEMNHQKFNFEYIKEKENFNDNFEPNLTPRLVEVDHRIKSDGAEPFKTKRNEIIDKYLYMENSLTIEKFDIRRYDLGLLCSSIECEMEFDKLEHIIKPLLYQIIDIFHLKSENFSFHNVFNVHKQHDIRTILVENLLDVKTSERVINIMFDKIDFSLFTYKTIDFYLEIFDGLVPYYFDDYINHNKRNLIEKILNKVEEKITSIKDEKIKNELAKILIMSPTNFFGDWSKFKTSYTYSDKMYINNKISKYGHLHIKEALQSIHRLHYQELFPELLLSIKNCLYKISKNIHSEIPTLDYNDFSYYLRLYSCYNFLSKEKDIKEDEDLTDAFEKVLEFQIAQGNEVAAVILDEFRVH